MLNVPPPVLPMLSKKAASIPRDEGWRFEPKWDGFRVLIFRDHDDVTLQSRDSKPLNRYFPELIAPVKAMLPERCVVDGEIVIAQNGALEFEVLQQRVHPAASRVKMLAEQTPASIVLWDLLCLGDRNLCTEPFDTRRAELAKLFETSVRPPIHLTPLTTSHEVAADWFKRFEGAGLDGVMAKLGTGAYEPNKRSMLKIKHERECDCVVAGFRWHKDGNGTLIGSLLLGLYDAHGKLQHVGVAASFTAVKRAELVSFLAPYRENALDFHPWKDWAGHEAGDDTKRMPGAKSRWSGGKDLSWEPLRPELVVEVGYDHMQGTRFRHTAQFRRWRTDKPPSACTYEQLEVVAPHEVGAIFSSGDSRKSKAT